MFVHFNPKRLRSMRLAASAALVLLTLTLYLTAHRAVGIRLKSGSQASLQNGCFTIGGIFDASRANSPSSGKLGMFAGYSHHADWTLAWRPFHATETLWPTAAKLHLVVVPLMPFALASALITGWAHGRLRGLRDARSSNCVSCGYDLSATPITDGNRVCPECGAKRGPLPTSRDAA